MESVGFMKRIAPTSATPAKSSHPTVTAQKKQKLQQMQSMDMSQVVCAQVGFVLIFTAKLQLNCAVSEAIQIALVQV